MRCCQNQYKISHALATRALYGMSDHKIYPTVPNCTTQITLYIYEYEAFCSDRFTWWFSYFNACVNRGIFNRSKLYEFCRILNASNSHTKPTQPKKIKLLISIKIVQVWNGHASNQQLNFNKPSTKICQ